MKNLFCDRSVLTSESTVESCFVDRLVRSLGYADASIRVKASIEELAIGRGSQKTRYRPDYVLLDGGTPRWLIDAKAPTEKLSAWVEQCASYCLVINRRQATGKKLRYFMLTNGVETSLYDWEKDRPVLTLQFGDFMAGNALLNRLNELISATAVAAWTTHAAAERRALMRPTPGIINAVFAKCNDLIYKRDNIAPAAAFHEVVKIVFLKIRADRELHRRFPSEMNDSAPVPVADITFSTEWIERFEAQFVSPLNSQFERLVRDLETEIRKGFKKRIYTDTEKIDLQPTTIKEVVAALEGYDLFGIDEDLNGRLFEAFLSSTMRGRALGQFFTPRSVVNLMTRLAAPIATRDHVDRVIDPCCGSGGFLIKALALMSRQVDSNGTLSGSEKAKIGAEIRMDSLFGVDAGRDPPIAKIARINMYLHGDGGSRIYVADALDKALENQGEMSPEHEAEVTELRRLLGRKDWTGFDVILTNPPFSKEYDAGTPAEKKILAAYDIRSSSGNQPIRSSVLFLERYRDLLKPGGRVLAVVDESILGSAKHASARDFIRQHFIVRAVVSLPGDAFQRSGARVKTSILYLTKRTGNDDTQSDVFMWYCTAVGVDDSARQRPSREDAANSKAAVAEIEEVLLAYDSARAGGSTANLVPAARIKDRLDVKSCVLTPGRKLAAWKELGLDAKPLGEWVTAREEVDASGGEETVRLLSVAYNGYPKEPDEYPRESIKYGSLYIVHAGDIVVSHINAVHGAVCVVPDHMDGALVSPEFTVLEPKSNVSPHALCAILRSPEIRAEIVTRSSGLGRHRITAAVLLALPIPSPLSTTATKANDAFAEARRMEAAALALRAKAQEDLETSMDLRGVEAQRIIKAFKPPQ